jgi:hypothetical protein
MEIETAVAFAERDEGSKKRAGLTTALGELGQRLDACWDFFVHVGERGGATSWS